ncbi:hypothetical protein ACJJIU_00955 [Microbulbifer sp. CnH-101-E]|uniref:Methyltransferase type 11 domain-containing protein n=1 Tax=Microbulbifer variabilis TaxID=266805 RepID=A0ABY4VDG5_9GAMM|nr:hypothetical protein [Microbulbifer variabilis]USD22276.1 hypothetical protein MJO52_03860 [Microbulbifer variabilis]
MNFNGPLIVNLGSGYKQPLREGELEFFPELKGWRILNFDKNEFPVAPYAYQFGGCNNLEWSYVQNADVMNKIPLGDCTVDVVLSVSPYGYSVLSKEVYRVLKPRGLILILGNGSNKYLDKKLKQDSFRQLEQSCNLYWYDMGVSCRGDFFKQYENVVERGLVERCKSYLMRRGSYDTSGMHETELNVCKVYRKMHVDF